MIPRLIFDNTQKVPGRLVFDSQLADKKKGTGLAAGFLGDRDLERRKREDEEILAVILAAISVI